MKKTFVIATILAAMASFNAAAAERGESCPGFGMLGASEQTGIVLSCGKDGKWHGAAEITPIDTAQIMIDVEITDGTNSVLKGSAMTLAGMTVPFSIYNKTGYIGTVNWVDGTPVQIPEFAKDGFSVTITPTVNATGQIELAFKATRDELISIDNVEQGGVMVQSPLTTSATIEQAASLVESGKAIQFPFGPADKYMLKLAATRI